MHVLSAVSESGVRFGNYKDAHKLDKNDPRWLHAKEVDMLKVVLCRFIKSQLTKTVSCASSRRSASFLLAARCIAG